MTTVTPPQLHKMIVESYNLQELRTLCFHLNIVFENLGGEGLSGKALALVEYSQRHLQYDQLVQSVQEARAQAAQNMGGGPSGAAAPVNPAQPAAKAGNTYTFYGPVTGSAIGQGSVQAENIAGRDINIHNYAEPTNKAEFAAQLAQLEALLKEAIANGEIKEARDAETAVADIQNAIAEVQHEQPRPSRISRRLEDVKEIIESASKAGAAALKAMPIIAGLIKMVQTIF